MCSPFGSKNKINILALLACTGVFFSCGNKKSHEEADKQGADGDVEQPSDKTKSTDTKEGAGLSLDANMLVSIDGGKYALFEGEGLESMPLENEPAKVMGAKDEQIYHSAMRSLKNPSAEIVATQNQSVFIYPEQNASPCEAKLGAPKLLQQSFVSLEENPEHAFWSEGQETNLLFPLEGLVGEKCTDVSGIVRGKNLPPAQEVLVSNTKGEKRKALTSSFRRSKLYKDKYKEDKWILDPRVQIHMFEAGEDFSLLWVTDHNHKDCADSTRLTVIGNSKTDEWKEVQFPEKMLFYPGKLWRLDEKGSLLYVANQVFHGGGAVSIGIDAKTLEYKIMSKEHIVDGL